MSRASIICGSQNIILGGKVWKIGAMTGRGLTTAADYNPESMRDQGRSTANWWGPRCRNCYRSLLLIVSRFYYPTALQDI